MIKSKFVPFLLALVVTFFSACKKNEMKKEGNEEALIPNFIEISKPSSDDNALILKDVNKNTSKIQWLMNTLSIDKFNYESTVVSNPKGLNDLKCLTQIINQKNPDIQLAYLVIVGENENRSFLMNLSKSKEKIDIYDLDDNKLISTNFEAGVPITSYSAYGFGAILTDADPCTGQNIINCINAAYTNNGWASVWAWVQTAVIPATAAGILVGCLAKHNCPSLN